MKSEHMKFRKQIFMFLHYLRSYERAFTKFLHKKNKENKLPPLNYSVHSITARTSHWLRKPFIVLCLFFSFHLSTVAQSNQLGIRLGYYSGLTFRHMNEKEFGVEVNLLKWMPYRGATLSLIGEKNFLLKQGFSMYAGAGLFVGNYRNGYYYKRDDKYYRYEFEGTYWGLEGVVGADYKFENAPVMLGLDLRPRFVHLMYPYPWDAGLNVRYVF
jgi:hypothetical protein